MRQPNAAAAIQGVPPASTLAPPAPTLLASHKRAVRAIRPNETIPGGVTGEARRGTTVADGAQGLQSPFAQAAPRDPAPLQPPPARPATGAQATANPAFASNMDVDGSRPTVHSRAPPTAYSTSLPKLAPECAQAVARVARVHQDKQAGAEALRECIPGLDSEQTFDGGATLARDIGRLLMDTPKSLDPFHQDKRVPSFLFVTPVTNPDAAHEDNPFAMPAGSKMSAAKVLLDKFAAFLLRQDFTFLADDGSAHAPVTAADVFEDGYRSFDVHIDDSQLTGLYTILVYSEHIEKLAVALRTGRFGYYFAPGLPRDEPPDALHVSIATEKNRGRVHIYPADVVYELFHQYRPALVYFITDSRAFKGQYVYMITCFSEDHVEYCLRNPVTLLGDVQFDAFRHRPAKGVNTFFLSGCMGVNDANTRIKGCLAGLLRVKASDVNFFLVNDLVSPNVKIMRVQAPDDAATCAQIYALITRGHLLSTTKPGAPTITYAASHVGEPIKVAMSLDELQKLVGHVIMRSPLQSPDAEPGEEPERIRAAPGTPQANRDELAGILASSLDPPDTDRSSRRRRNPPLGGSSLPPAPNIMRPPPTRQLSPAIPVANPGCHPGFACDRSRMDPIVGTRFHLRGQNYDLCQAEFDKLSAADQAAFEAIPPTVDMVDVTGQVQTGVAQVPVEGGQEGGGMLFIVEHYFALKRAARRWRLRRNLLPSNLADSLSTRMLQAHGGVVDTRAQAVRHPPSPVTPMVAASNPSALPAAPHVALGHETTRPTRRELGAPLRPSVGSGERRGRVHKRAESRSAAHGARHGAGVALDRDAGSPMGGPRGGLGTRLDCELGAHPLVAAQHARQGGVLHREGSRVSCFSHRHGLRGPDPQYLVYVGIHSPVAGPQTGGGLATLTNGDVGTARYHVTGQQWQWEFVSRRGRWACWGHSPLTLSWVRVTAWHGFLGRRFANVHCPRRRVLAWVTGPTRAEVFGDNCPYRRDALFWRRSAVTALSWHRAVSARRNFAVWLCGPSVCVRCGARGSRRAAASSLLRRRCVSAAPFSFTAGDGAGDGAGSTRRRVTPLQLLFRRRRPLRAFDGFDTDAWIKLSWGCSGRVSILNGERGAFRGVLQILHLGDKEFDKEFDSLARRTDKQDLRAAEVRAASTVFQLFDRERHWGALPHVGVWSLPGAQAEVTLVLEDDFDFVPDLAYWLLAVLHEISALLDASATAAPDAICLGRRMKWPHHYKLLSAPLPQWPSALSQQAARCDETCHPAAWMQAVMLALCWRGALLTQRNFVVWLCGSSVCVLVLRRVRGSRLAAAVHQVHRRCGPVAPSGFTAGGVAKDGAGFATFAVTPASSTAFATTIATAVTATAATDFAIFSSASHATRGRARPTLRLRGGADEQLDDQPHLQLDPLLPAANENGYSLLSLNMQGTAISERQAAGFDHLDCRSRSLLSTIQLWRRPALVALQELGGGQASVDRLAAELFRLGYDVTARAGEETDSRKDAHRRGGVLLAWHRSQFRNASMSQRGDRDCKAIALLHSGDIEAAQAEGRLTSAIADQLQRYAGRRALGIRLTRTRGPLANEELFFACVYVPASASHTVRAAFIELVADKVQSLTIDAVSGTLALPFAIAGDWNASPSPAARRNGSPNDVHDEALHRRWFGGSDDDAFSAAIPSGLKKGEYTFRASTGHLHDRDLDFVFVDCESFPFWRSSEQGGIFLGEWGNDGDVFDHRVSLSFRDEGTLEKLGEGRAPTFRISKAPSCWHTYGRLAAQFAAPGGVTADLALAALEEHLVRSASTAMGADAWASRAPRAAPPDEPEVRLKWLRGLYSAVSASYEWNADHDDRASALFSDGGTDRLYKAVILRRVRDRETRRAAESGRVLSWKDLRNACAKRLRDAIARLQPEVDARRRQLNKAINLGVGEPCSAQEFTERMHDRLRAIRQRKRANKFQLSALINAEGDVERRAGPVHALAHSYGVAQNRLSASDDEAFGTWLQLLVPSFPTLTLPDGAPWTLRAALPADVLRREARKQRKGKARAFNPFIIEMLQCLPDGHPAESAYFELLLRCMEEGIFPAHYLQIVAVLLPKKAAGLLQMALLRDIWLINHGAKLAERCLLHTALTPVGARVLSNHAGGCRGRGCTEQAFALHLCIDDALSRRKSLYVLYVDLTKCFMSFSRTAGAQAMRHYGVPEQALRALRGLVENVKHGVAQGRYETAFGATDPFPILRGFLQGAQGSPEACKIMMDTIAQALELKVSGYTAFAPDGAGGEMGSLIFVDDAANATGDASFLNRVTLLWSIWSRITDCQLNIKGNNKTVVQSLEYKRGRDGTLIPTETRKKFYIAAVIAGDLPRRIPNLLITEYYLYCGMATRMDGRHNENGLSTLRSKIASCGAQATTAPTSRRLALGCAGLGINGNAFFYGACFGGSFEAVEERLGPTCRRVLQQKGVKGSRRSFSSPRVQLHASPGGISSSVNDDLSQLFVAAAGPAAFASGYGNVHVWPAMMAASLMTLVNALASPVHTPAADRTHHAVARVLWVYGFRQLDYGPRGIYFGAVSESLRLDNIVERPLWILCQLGAGFLPLVDVHFDDWSPLCPWRWPGYPPDWIALWHGPLYAQLRGKGLAFCHILATGGVAELANLCDSENFDFLDEDAILAAHPRAVELGAAQAKREIHALMGAIRACHISPVPGRGGWAMADAADGFIPSYAPAEFGLFRQLGLADLAARKRSGDGGTSLASQLGVTITLPPINLALERLPQGPVSISFTHAQHGTPFNATLPPASIEKLLRTFHELVPIFLDLATSAPYLANPGNFWSGCLHARCLAQLLVSDPTLLPSVDALAVLHLMRAQGVDWLQWLIARPEETRQPLRLDDDEDDDELDPRITPDQSVDDRLATLSERRDFLRLDDEACQRLAATIYDHTDQDQLGDDALRMLQWLQEGDIHIDPPSDGTGNSPCQRGTSSPDPLASRDSPLPAPADATHLAMQQPIVAMWQREPMLVVDPYLSRDSPELLMREQLRPPLLTDEACRVVRCTDAFGVLLVGLSERAPPSDATIHRAFVEAKTRLEFAQSRQERGVTVRHPRWQIARRRINGAWIALKHRETRLEVWSRWILQRKGPVTSTVKCVIHAAALRALLASPAAAAPGRSPGVTLGDEIAELLLASSEQSSNSALRFLNVEYTHSERGARLVASGFVRYSREYATGPDPFKCSKPVRQAAFGEVSHDFDDAVSFPTAQQALFPNSLVYRGSVIHALQSATLIAHAATVRAAVGRHFFREDLLGATEVYSRAKVLLSAVENGASCESWLRQQPPGDVHSHDVRADISISPSVTFNLSLFAREQDARARWLATSRPHLVQYVELINSLLHEGARDGELTAKSYILQDYEGASRRAKCEWARRWQAEIINLQHDGVRMRIPRDLSPLDVAQHLSNFCSAALGYRQSVTIKSSPSGPLLLDRVQPSLTPPHVPNSVSAIFTPGVKVLDSGRLRALKESFTALVGDSLLPPTPTSPGTAGPSQLDLDGATRRAIFYYDSKLPTGDRRWNERVQGGFHVKWAGRGPAWLARARLAYSFNDAGRLQGNPSHPDCPLAARFWWECQLVCDKARKAIKRKECLFVFDKLLELEAEYPVTHFVATDGSKDTHEETGATRVSRACLAVAQGVLGHAVLGGQLDVYADTFERHSYEAELAAFQDHLAATRDSVTVLVTDCLSGMQAGHAFSGRTISSKAARYRDKELGNISELEQRHRAILYVHIHSHDGITPNEAADTTAKFMLDSPLLPLDLMPSAHTKCRIAGVKRGVGRAAFDFCSALMTAKLAGASSFTLLETSDTWPLLRRSPVKAKLLTEATFDCIMDARADRCGLLADRLGAGLRERTLPGEAQIDRLREFRAQKGSWEWWCQTHAPCPCTGCFLARDVTVAGIWRPPPARAPQSRWHTLTTCCVGDSVQYRSRAIGWLSPRLSDFGTQQAHFALAALSGGSDRLGPREQHAALRFMLGLPDTPRSQLITESPEAARTLALGYGRGFLKWIAAIVREGQKAACTARMGSLTKVNAVRTTVVSYRDHTVIIDRPAPRAKWMDSRGLREVWDGACLVRRSFRALRLWATMAGIVVLDRTRKPFTEPDREGGREAGDWAYDDWDSELSVFTAFYKLARHARSNTTLDIAWAFSCAAKQQRRLVWLRNAGFDPTVARRKQARVDARRQAALDARLRRQAAKATRAAAHAARREQARVARAAEAELTEAARLQSAAVTRTQRSTVAYTVGAMDAARQCNQSSSFEPPPPEATASRAPQPPRFRCTRGHFLVPAPVRGGRGGFQPLCNGPCGSRIRPGTTRWMCEGHGCDLDICLDCVGTDDSVGISRSRIRCPRGHSMCFCLTPALAPSSRNCDGECRRPLVEGTWAYECEPCSLDLCAACAPGGIPPTAAQPAARAPRKRAREPPPRSAYRLQPAQRSGALRRPRPSKQRRTLFDDESDGVLHSEAESQPASQGEVRARRDKRSREPDAPSRMARGPQRQPYGEGPGRKRSSPPSIHSRGQGP